MELASSLHMSSATQLDDLRDFKSSKKSTSSRVASYRLKQNVISVDGPLLLIKRRCNFEGRPGQQAKNKQALSDHDALLISLLIVPNEGKKESGDLYFSRGGRMCG